MKKLVGLCVPLAALAVTGPAYGAEIKVTTLSDGFASDGKCALREAIQAANDNSKEDACAKGSATKRDVIILKGAQYQLSFTTTNEDANANGDFDVKAGGPVTVMGAGRTKTELRQNSADRIFDLVGGAVNLTLKGMTLTGGDVRAQAGAGNRGGAVRVGSAGAKLSASDLEFSSNEALIGGGVAVTSNSSATIKSSRFVSNTANARGGGLAIENGSTAKVSTSLFQQNEASSSLNPASGGGISNEGTAKISTSTIQANTVATNGGGNFATGGGVFSGNSLTLKRSLVQGNSTSASTDNVSEGGGGVWTSGSAEIANSTLFNNIAGVPGDNDGDGGAVFANAGATSIFFTTIDSNAATGAGDGVYRGGGVLTIGQTLIAGTDPCGGMMPTSQGFNAIEQADPQCAVGQTDISPADVSTDAPANNGGPTKTISIAPASSAVNKVPKDVCKARSSGVDQRGFTRPAKGGKCDIGAFEVGAKKKKKGKGR